MPEEQEKDPIQAKIESASGLVTQFTEFNGIIQVSQVDPNTTTNKLPVGIYSLRISMSGYYLELESQPKLPPKLFGNTKARADLIVNTYKDRDVSTGVLLIGNKGQGKTLLANVVTDLLLKEGVPVILIPSGFSGAAFNSFLGVLGDCCLIFDEFAKLYNNDKQDQDALLTLFDGTKSTKRLIILTENEEYNINNFLLGRPGRILYKFKYGTIQLDVVEEVLDYWQISQEVKLQILHYATDINDMSMDILKAIVDEHKRYPQDDIKDIVERLNVTTSSSNSNYEFRPEKFELTAAGEAAELIHHVFTNNVVFVASESYKQKQIKFYTTEKFENGEKNDSYDKNYKFDVTDDYEDVLTLRKDKPKAIKDGKYLYTHPLFSVVGTWHEIKPVYNYGGFF